MNNIIYRTPPRISLLKTEAFLQSTKYFKRLQIQREVQTPKRSKMSEFRRHQILEGFLKQIRLSDKHRARLLELGLSDTTIDFVMIRDAPGLIVNLEASASLVKEFGALNDVPGFVLTEFSNFKFEIFDSLAGFALLCAERLPSGNIAAIRLFRGLRDENSFRVRAGNVESGL